MSNVPSTHFLDANDANSTGEEIEEVDTSSDPYRVPGRAYARHLDHCGGVIPGQSDKHNSWHFIFFAELHDGVYAGDLLEQLQTTANDQSSPEAVTRYDWLEHPLVTWLADAH